MSMIVQFQGLTGPVFIHRDAIVTITTTPQLGLMAKGARKAGTVLTLDNGSTVEVTDDPLHAAEKWEQAFEEDFDHEDYLSSEEEIEQELFTKNLKMAEREVLGALLGIAEDPTRLPDLSTLSAESSARLRAALEAWADVQGEVVEDEGDEEDDDADD